MITQFRSHQIVGKGVGRRHLFPTINMAVPIQVSLDHGIYGAWLSLKYRNAPILSLPAAVHFGPRPTFNDSQVSLEAYVLSGAPLDSTYDPQDIHVEIVQFVRGILRFENIAELRIQIQYDIQTIKTLLGLDPS